MGELVGLPEWLAKFLFVTVCLIMVFGVAAGVRIRALGRLVASRPSPTRDQFLALMENDASKAAAEFLWDKALIFTRPQFAPHPDDELGNDLFIDDGEWSMDWPIEWAERNGFNHSNLPEWPHEWRPTLRNYGRWLSLEIT